MKFTFPALKKFHPKNFDASSRNTTATAIVTHRPHIIPPMTRLKSLAPRTSPYSVAPQFGHRIQKHRNGISSSVSPKNGENPRFGTMVPPLAFDAAAMVAPYAPWAPNRLAADLLEPLTNPAWDPNSMTRT